MTMIAASSSADGTLSSYKPLKSAYYNPTEQEKQQRTDNPSRQL